MKVMVYRNLHKKCWSVRVGGRVKHHLNSLTLRDCTFKVWEGVRQRVLREQKKFVHAFVIGEMVDNPPSFTEAVQVSYNPYKGPHFYEKSSGQSVFAAPTMVFTTEGSVFSVN